MTCSHPVVEHDERDRPWCGVCGRPIPRVTMIDEDEEWQVWNVKVRFEFAFVSEGPFPEDMPEDERREQVREEFWDNAWDAFYNAYSSTYDIQNALEILEVEPYEQ